MTYFHVPLIIAHFNLRQPKKTYSELFLVKSYIPGIAEQNVSVVLTYLSYFSLMCRLTTFSCVSTFYLKNILFSRVCRILYKITNCVH